jgi:hypothetical protein
MFLGSEPNGRQRELGACLGEVSPVYLFSRTHPLPFVFEGDYGAGHSTA